MPALLSKVLMMFKPIIAKLILDYIFSIIWEAAIEKLTELSSQTDNNIDDKTVAFIGGKRDEFKQKAKELL